MVKKYVFRLPCESELLASDCSSSCSSEAVRNNTVVHAILNRAKDQISKHTGSKRRTDMDMDTDTDMSGTGPSMGWDEAKRLSNRYELVHSTTLFQNGAHRGIASNQPISRSFFKLWEILHDFEHLLGVPLGGERVSSAFLAEGPGGFVESFATYRGADATDQLHCISLVSPSRAVPAWRLNSVVRGLVDKTRLHVHAGEDGTGNLYRVENIDHFVAAVGHGTCQLVTADGGFDFSRDFNGQERASLRLVLCECYTTLRLQKHGGAFVLKLFDIQHALTMSILHGLWSCYGEVHIVKPLTSRPANSEKYVVCTGFRGCGQECLQRWRSAVVQEESLSCLSPCLSPPPRWFCCAVAHYNTFYVARQIACIAAAIALIGAGKSDRTRLMRLQLSKSIRWCQKYNIQISKTALRDWDNAIKISV